MCEYRYCTGGVCVSTGPFPESLAVSEREVFRGRSGSDDSPANVTCNELDMTHNEWSMTE